MLVISRLFSPLSKFTYSQKLLYTVSLMLFFWALFDGVLGYLFPLLVTQNGFSKTEVGFIFGSGSIFGGIFDFLFCKYVKNTHFRRVFLVMFAICFVYPLILLQAKTIAFYVLSMILWSIFYDLQNFGSFDFVGRKAENSEHASHFGIIGIFKSLGYLLAPLLAGLVIDTVIGWKPFALSWILIGISFEFFVIVLVLTRRKKDLLEAQQEVKPAKIVRELFLWKTIGRILFPVLILTVLLNTIDAFFWTIGPLLAESYTNLHPFNGLVMTAYEFPFLISGWWVGSVTSRFGKKKTAFFSLLVGLFFLILLPMVQNVIGVLVLIFIASCFLAFSWPSINGAYADYISESMKYEKEIESLEGFSVNVGYIIGPMIGGYFADKVGNAGSFAIIALLSIAVTIILLKFTPRYITVKI